MRSWDGVNENERHSTIRLRDGRTLGYLEVGLRDGPVVIHCHGGGSSRLEVLFLAQAAADLGVRLIGIDRPGIGRSDPHDYVNLIDWAGDVQDLADQLRVDTFAIQGMSKGGPYALACAYKLPKRVRACGLISTVPPADTMQEKGPMGMRLIWWLGQRHPEAFRLFLRYVFPDRSSCPSEAEKQMRRARRWLSKADREVLAPATMRALVARVFAEHHRHGGIGARSDARLSMRAWGFDLETVSVKKLFLWHGKEDRVIGYVLAEALAAALPHCISKFYSCEGHISVLMNHARDILAQMK